MSASRGRGSKLRLVEALFTRPSKQEKDHASSMGDLMNHGTITGDIKASLTDEFTQTGVFTNDGTWNIGAMTDAQFRLNDFDSTENAVLALTLQSAGERQDDRHVVAP